MTLHNLFDPRKARGAPVPDWRGGARRRSRARAPCTAVLRSLVGCLAVAMLSGCLTAQNKVDRANSQALRAATVETLRASGVVLLVDGCYAKASLGGTRYLMTESLRVGELTGRMITDEAASGLEAACAAACGTCSWRELRNLAPTLLL